MTDNKTTTKEEIALWLFYDIREIAFDLTKQKFKDKKEMFDWLETKLKKNIEIYKG